MNVQKSKRKKEMDCFKEERMPDSEVKEIKYYIYKKSWRN